MASSSASAPSWKYDVFLSFRGEDTRLNFTSFLDQELKRNGITTFIDDRLRIGDQISPALLQAIEDSRFSIVIFSQNYASSSWCLDELTKILECVDKRGHTAFPVFYEVDPSHVRKQKGSYAEAFKKHGEAHNNNTEKVEKWKQALSTACGYVGWDTRGRKQTEVIKEIVSKIFNKVPANPSSSNNIGMDSRIDDVLSLLCIGSHDVRMVGIWGMAGIGKTTLAEAIYQRIHTQFECFGFLSNVREKSQRKKNLQKKLLSEIFQEDNLGSRDFGSDSIRKALHSKQVLIVLDDVNHIKQLEQLAGHHAWFGPKSRIIITTRDKRLLTEQDVDAVYEAKELQNKEAGMLFCLHAFRDKLPMEDFKELCNRFLDYTKGNPLTIKILGCLLYKRTKIEWGCELEKLKKIPNKDVQEILRISFDELDDTVKNIFLDIACIFKEEDKDYVSKLLTCCNFYPERGINTLVEKALITISYNNKLCMHDLIQKMGWEIVRQESIEFPGKRSRLWSNEDIEDVLTTNSGTETVQAIALDLSTLEGSLDFNVDVFTKMIKLRLLKIHSFEEREYYWRLPSSKYKMHLKGDFTFLSNNLVYLRWREYPLKSLPSSFYPRKLFELNMSFSHLEQLWEGQKSFQNLEYMDLRHSRDLIRTPDLSGALKLKEINLEACTSLVEVHSSIETLEKLRILNLNGCSSLEKVAKSFHKLTSLERVGFNGCSKLTILPNDLRISSQYLNLSDCSKLEELPNSVGELTSLKHLNLQGCSKLQKLPKNIGELTSLLSLILTGCSGLKKLPTDLGRLQWLDKLMANESGIQELPHSLTLLTRLKTLKLRDCNLQEVGDISPLCSLRLLDLSDNNFTSLPSLTPLTQLLKLNLNGCKSLQALTELPSSIHIVSANNCESLETFSHPPNSYAMSKSSKLMFDFSNCERLLENEESLEAILRGIRIVPLIRRNRRFGVVVPGRSVSEWFTHRSKGNSITVKLPPDFHGRAVGLGFCILVGRNFLERCFNHHLWFGYDAMISDETLLECFSHLKFTFVTYVWATIEQCGIRLLYSPVPSKEFAGYQIDEEYDTYESYYIDMEEEYDTYEPYYIDMEEEFDTYEPYYIDMEEEYDTYEPYYIDMEEEYDTYESYYTEEFIDTDEEYNTYESYYPEEFNDTVEEYDTYESYYPEELIDTPEEYDTEIIDTKMIIEHETVKTSSVLTTPKLNTMLKPLYLNRVQLLPLRIKVEGYNINGLETSSVQKSSNLDETQINEFSMKINDLEQIRKRKDPPESSDSQSKHRRA